MIRSLMALTMVAFGLGACSSTPADGPAESPEEAPKAAEAEAKAPEAPKPAPAKPALPSETERVALDQDKGEIPATIAAPKGSTTFFDSPTRVRVSYEKGELFGVQVAKGNEYNTKFEQKDGVNEYGVTTKVISKTDEMVLYTHTSDGHTTHKFSIIVKVGEQQWVCSQGNYGGWSEPQARHQIEVCKTLAAK